MKGVGVLDERVRSKCYGCDGGQQQLLAVTWEDETLMRDPDVCKHDDYFQVVV